MIHHFSSNRQVFRSKLDFSRSTQNHHQEWVESAITYKTGSPVNLRNDYSFSYNDKIKNKVCPDKSEFTKFNSYSGDANEFIGIVKRGFAFSPSVYLKNYRSTNNFLKCDILAWDIDNSKKVEKLDENGNVVRDEKGSIIYENIYDEKLTLAQAKENEFIKKYCLLNTTFSHTKEWNRFRITCFLPVTIVDGELAKQVLREIDGILGGGVVDSACIDYARLFFGNDNAEWFNDDFSKVYELPYELILEARENLAKVTQERELKRQERRAKKAQFNLSANEKENLINELLTYIPEKILGDGLYPDYRAIFCAVANELGKEKAIEIANTHSPCKDWTQVINSSNGEFSLGTIYHYAKLWGNYEKPINSDNLSGFSGFQQWLIKSINRLSKAFKKGFKTQKLPVPDLLPERIVYEPDMELPKPDDYPNGVIPEFFMPRKYNNKITIAKVIKQLLNLGWVVHDMRFLGEGKSSTIPLMDNVLYVDSNYRNPSIDLIDKMPFIPSRSEKGTYQINGKIKVDPSDEEIREGEKIGAPNCHLKSVFSAVKSKGFDVENNSICGKCPNFSSCHIIDKDNVGLGYRGERGAAIRNILATGQGRAHIKQVHKEELLDEFEDSTTAIEEASRVNLTNSLIATVDDIDRAIAKVTRINFNKDNDSDVCAVDVDFRTDVVIGFLNQLRSLVLSAYDVHLDMKTGTKFHGLDQTQVENNLTIPEFTENELAYLYGAFDLNIDDIIPDFERVERQGLDKKTTAQARRAENFMKGEHLNEVKENLKTLENNWFCRFLDVLFGYEKGSFRITKNNEFEVITKDSHHIDIAKNAKRLLLLDATATTQQLKALYQIDKPILTFKTELPPLKNLKVINVNMKGMSSNDWSDNLIERLCLLKNKLGTINNDNITFLTPKKHSEVLGTKYYFGRDDRGSNELMGYSAIAHFGVPMPNLGDMRIIYDLYFSGISDYSFEDYYQDQVRENQLQALGRSRVQHSPDKNFTHYFVGTGQDFSWLNQFGVMVENVNVMDICEEAGSKGDKTRKFIFDTAKAIVANGEKLSQEAIAQINGFSQQLVSKAFKGSELSWKGFKNLLLNLYSSHKEKVVKNSDSIDLLEAWLNEGNTDILEVVVNKVILEGMDGLIQIATELNATLETLYRLLWLIAPLYDKRLLELREKLLLEIS